MTETRSVEDQSDMNEELSSGNTGPDVLADAAGAVGAQLRSAREGKGQSIAEVSEALRFGTAQILAIESGQIGLLPGETFVRGMVRSYAKFLGIDAQPLLQRLGNSNAALSSALAPPSNSGSVAREDAGTITTARRVIFFLMFVIALTAALYVVVARDLADIGGAESTSVQAREPVSGPVAQASVTSDSQSMGTAAGSPVFDAHLSKSDKSAEQTVQEGTFREVALRFSDLSWIEVRDGSGNVILAGEFGAGTERMVRGSPPLKIWVGRANAVGATIHDKTIDLVSSSRDGVARVVVE